MISLNRLTRTFGPRTVVDGVSFEVPAGRLCALLGPNGAGKTTTVRLLLGLIRPTSGSATVADERVPGTPEGERRLRARCGLLTETPGFYDRVSAWDNLVLFGRLHGLDDGRLHPAIEHHLRYMELWDRRGDPVATFSRGMKQRLAIVRALLHDPEVLFLDEPTAGLDPASSRDVRELVTRLKQEGRTILLTTHNLPEAEELADLVGVLSSSLLAFGTPEQLMATGRTREVEVRLASDPAPFRDAIALRPYTLSLAVADSALVVGLADPARQTPDLVDDLVQAGARIVEVRPRRTSLEQVYLEAVNREAV